MHACEPEFTRQTSLPLDNYQGQGNTANIVSDRAQKNADFKAILEIYCKFLIKNSNVCNIPYKHKVLV